MTGAEVGPGMAGAGVGPGMVEGRQGLVNGSVQHIGCLKDKGRHSGRRRDKGGYIGHLRGSGGRNKRYGEKLAQICWC